MGKLVIIKMIIKVESTHQHLFGPGTSRDVHIIEFRSSWDTHFVPPFHWSYCCYAVRWKINLEQRNPKKMLYNFHCFGSAAASAGFFYAVLFFSPPQPTSNLHTNSPAQLKHFPIFALPERVFIVCRGISLSVNSGEKQLELLPCDSTAHSFEQIFENFPIFISVIFREGLWAFSHWARVWLKPTQNKEREKIVFSICFHFISCW